MSNEKEQPAIARIKTFLTRRTTTMMHRRRNTKDENGNVIVPADDDNKKYGRSGKNRCGLFVMLGVLANIAVLWLVKKNPSTSSLGSDNSIPHEQPAPQNKNIVLLDHEKDPAPAARDSDKPLPIPTEPAAIPSVPPPKMIPRRLIFSYKYKLIAPSEEDPPLDPTDPLTANALHTIQKYETFWAKDDSAKEKTVVSFVTDKDCIKLLRKAERRLVRHFLLERRGELKADLCRAAELYLHGGYYFDVDIGVIEPVNFDTLHASSLPGPDALTHLRAMKRGVPPLKIGKDDIVTFATVYNKYGQFFLGFTAATPLHPVLKKSLEYMVAYYDGTLSQVLPQSILEEHRGDGNPLPSRNKRFGQNAGPYTLLAAYRSTTDDEWDQYAKDLMKESGYSSEQKKSHEEIPAKKRYSRFLYEVSLEDEGLKAMDLFQDVPLQDAKYEKKYEYCNRACVGGSNVFFYSSIPGSRACPGPEGFVRPAPDEPGPGYH